ncbi:DUF779 domain-containing protein [Derxia lacustris]|uniref:DUF779 domain-containing protein n=1 Tax=Derxia lacustris TaxID=764842 RepID=UPI000A1726F5|nr:DUF779 domain-containing protein [Derxia lacustris]
MGIATRPNDLRTDIPDPDPDNLPVDMTPVARELLERIVADHGPVMFHQSGGCCEGSSPLCFPKGEFKVGTTDVLVGRIGETEVWMDREQWRTWAHTGWSIDAVPSRGSSFSLDVLYDMAFIVRTTYCALPGTVAGAHPGNV